MKGKEPLGLTFAAIAEATERLRGVAVRTPLIRSTALDALTGCRVFVKVEALQIGGAFKFRGAFNRLFQLSTAQRERGVIAWSSGNHAQGVAAAASQLGISATIVMPSDAPAIKLSNTRRLGARVVFYDRLQNNREEVARRLVDETGAVLVPSYDDYDVMAGQGTVGVEVHEQLSALGLAPEYVLVPCGGGGLIAGVATALAHLAPGSRVYAVEPSEFDDTARSLAAGHRETNARFNGSICDALLAPTPGHLTFPINRALLAGGIVVDELHVRKAVRFAATELKIVLEPGGATGLAALFVQPPPAGSTVVVVASGGNIDPALLAAITNECDDRPSGPVPARPIGSLGPRPSD